MLTLKSVNFEQQQFQKHHLQPSYAGQLEWKIGRSSSCDLVLANPAVSRVHGHIIYIDESYYFIDVGSTSGSLVNGTTVAANDKCPLRLGDLIQLGETFLYVEELAKPSLVPTGTDVVDIPFTLPQTEWSDEDLVCRCCRIVDETHDVKTFYFVAEPGVLFNYLPGQFVSLSVEIDGKTVIRPYSISSSPTRPYHLSITVKRVASPDGQPDVPIGLVSNWLHDHLQVGDRVKFIGGAMGTFTCLPHVPSKLLLISAGSGITPMMSMVRWIQDTLVDCDIVFLHSARTVDNIVFRAELEAIATQMPNFHLAVTLTQPTSGQSWMGLTGRISPSMLHLVAPDLLERSVYVCGPSGFMQSIRTLLTTMQFPMSNYQEESFGDKPSSALTGHSATSERLSESVSEAITTVPVNQNGHHLTGDRPSTMPPPRQNATIRFIASDQTASADEHTTILEIAEQVGVQIRHACRVGACGACRVRVHQGQVRYDTPPTALTPLDHQTGFALACVGYAVDDLEIEA